MYQVKDAEFHVSKALPAEAGAVYSDGLDLRIPSSGQFLAPAEILITGPALTNAQLGSAATMTYDVQCAPDAEFAGVRTLAQAVLVQTGDGTGASAASARFRPPTNCDRYVRIKATNSAAGDCSDAALSVDLLF
ncbi:MAG: hypothetical protein GX547_16200 [Phycisphaerae bacterium]|nr:hypothetical protein [Phycisphaerae bacterium]